jgi:gliding motility-associated-like protein
LNPGNYSVTVTDINGCSITYSATVNELAPVVISATANNPLCFGFNNGGIDVTMTGGMGPYNYSWSTGFNNQDLDSLVAGDYILTVTDSNNCMAMDTITIYDPLALNLDLTSPVLSNGYNISYFGGSDGFVYSSLSGGTVPYAYSWSNGETGPDLSNIMSGTYYLTVTDDNGCLIGDSIVVTQPDSLEMPTGYTPNNDGYNDGFIVHGIDNYPDNYLTVINRWGNVVFEQANYNNTWKGESSAGLALPDGTYFVILEVRGINVVLKSYVDIRR